MTPADIAACSVALVWFFWVVIVLLEVRPPYLARAWNLAKRLVRRPRPEPFDFESAYQEVMAIDLQGQPLYQIEAWTPQERDALGVNDTIAAIAHLDEELAVEDRKRLPRAIRRGQFMSVDDDDAEVVEIRAWSDPDPIYVYNDGGVVR